MHENVQKRRNLPSVNDRGRLRKTGRRCFPEPTATRRHTAVSGHLFPESPLHRMASILERVRCGSKCRRRSKLSSKASCEKNVMSGDIILRPIGDLGADGNVPRTGVLRKHCRKYDRGKPYDDCQHGDRGRCQNVHFLPRMEDRRILVRSNSMTIRRA